MEDHIFLAPVSGSDSQKTVQLRCRLAAWYLWENMAISAVQPTRYPQRRDSSQPQ